MIIVIKQSNKNTHSRARDLIHVRYFIFVRISYIQISFLRAFALRHKSICRMNIDSQLLYI